MPVAGPDPGLNPQPPTLGLWNGYGTTDEHGCTRIGSVQSRAAASRTACVEEAGHRRFAQGGRIANQDPRSAFALNPDCSESRWYLISPVPRTVDHGSI